MLLFAGSYFCFDNPGALQDDFKVDLQMSTSKFVLLYSIYSWPNVILCFIGGFLLDSVFGIRLGTIIYMGLTLIGQIIFATGAMVNEFWVMMVGRFVFGYVFLYKLGIFYDYGINFGTFAALVQNHWPLLKIITPFYGSKERN